MKGYPVPWKTYAFVLPPPLQVHRQHQRPVRRVLLFGDGVLRGDGQLQTVGANGKASAAVVQPHTLVLSFLVVLLYRQEGRLRSLTLLSDSLAAEDFRQLRLWLRWRSSAANPA